MIEKLLKYEEEGYIRSAKHPYLELIIWTYTNKTQYERKWDDVTLICRGLVTDFGGNIVSMPLKKFFNLSELEEVPDERYTVEEKLDGSLIQAFYYKDSWVFTSKGSFTSPQVLMAKSIVSLDQLDIPRNLTYVFELIHPENRIVVDYGDLKALILLTTISRDTFEEVDITPEVRFYFARPYTCPTKELEDLKASVPLYEEGFVVKFKSGLRVKVKGDEYLRLHRIVTQTSSTDVWRVLREGGVLKELTERVPDEFLNWFHKLVGELTVEHSIIVDYITEDVVTLVDLGYITKDIVILKSKKEVAEIVNTMKYPHLVFKFINKGKLDKGDVWDLVKPKHSKAFSI